MISEVKDRYYEFVEKEEILIDDIPGYLVSANNYVKELEEKLSLSNEHRDAYLKNNFQTQKSLHVAIRGYTRLEEENKELQERLKWCEVLQVGKFSIGRYDKDSFWIQNESGEGMQVSEKDLNKLWEDFFKENF